MLSNNKVLMPGAEKPLTHLKPRKVRSTLKNELLNLKWTTKVRIQGEPVALQVEQNLSTLFLKKTFTFFFQISFF